MKAQDYVEKMDAIIHDGGDENDALSYLAFSLINETVELIKARNAKRPKAIVGIFNEVSKKYEAIKRRDPFYWGGKDDPFYQSKFIDLVRIADKTRAEVWEKLLINEKLSRMVGNKSRRRR